MTVASVVTFVVLFLIHLWQSGNAPGAMSYKFSAFDKPETFQWVRWDSYADYAQKIPLKAVGSVTFWGDAVGCFGHDDEIKVTNSRVIRILKEGLDNAQCPSPDASMPGVAGTNQLMFHPKTGNTSFEERKAKFAFHPWWPSLSFGPRFYEALRTFSRYYAAQMRHRLLHIKPTTIKTIDLEYTSGGFSELASKTEVARLLHAAGSLDSTAYDVTDKDRVPVRMVLWTKSNKSQTFFFLLPDGKNKKRGAFAEMVYKFYDKSPTVSTHGVRSAAENAGKFLFSGFPLSGDTVEERAKRFLTGRCCPTHQKSARTERHTNV